MMAGEPESFSNKSLWQFISGTGVIRAKEFITIELAANKKKLLNGLLTYRRQSTPSGELLKKERKLMGIQLEFTQKLAVFLGLEEVLAHDLLCAFLGNEFRGSQKNLQQILSHERQATALLMKIRDFYYNERLCLLRCLRQVITHWPDPRHPYREAYATFINDAHRNDSLLKKLYEQFDMCVESCLPTWETHGTLMTEQTVLAWAQQNLKEQCELLELMLIYFKDFEIDVDGFIDLLKRFKQHGFGHRQSYKHILDESSEKVVKQIAYLEVLILLEIMDVENAFRCRKEGNFEEHLMLSHRESFKKVDTQVRETLQSENIHGPLLLCWMIIRHLYLEDQASEAEAAVTRKLGNQALHLSVFPILQDMLLSEPFCGKSIVASICQYVVFTLVDCTLANFSEDSLGNAECLHEIAVKLFKKEFVADSLWNKGMEEGLGVLFQSACLWFPLHFKTLVELASSLAAAGPTSAQRVCTALRKLHTYSEYLDANSSQDLLATHDPQVFQLACIKRSYATGSLVLPSRSCGQLVHVTGKKGGGSDIPIMQWDVPYSAWQLFQDEVSDLLQKASQGIGMVSPTQVSKVSMVMHLLKEVMSSFPECVEDFLETVSLGYQILHRFAGLVQAPLELLGHTVLCLTHVAKLYPTEVWHNIKQAGLLPYLTENIDNVGELLSGRGLSPGLWGRLLTSLECSQGRYPLTQACLALVTQLVEPLYQEGREDELEAALMFIQRQIFPLHHKWRYAEAGLREQLGLKCMVLFHTILNIIKLKKTTSSKGGPQLQQVCTYSLLYTEAGRALLDVLGTGTETIDNALLFQGKVPEEVGESLVKLVLMSFSVTNRLLLLREPDLPPSPTESALTSQPAGRQTRHIVAVIASYIYHRHNPRLPTLATILLRRLAQMSPMSLLACLGGEAESVRDMYLHRLQAQAEDMRLKVVILELLSVCVETQPGLIEIFLNVQPGSGPVSDFTTSTLTSSTTSSSSTPASAAAQNKKLDLTLGKSSCLQTVLSLMEVKKQGTYHCPPDLLCACLDFVNSLWQGFRENAMEVLRAKENFWPSVCSALSRDILGEGEEDSVQVLPYEMKTAGFIFHILAQEIYVVGSGSKLKAQLQQELHTLGNKKRLLYWSQFVLRSQQAEGKTEEGVKLGEDLTERPALLMLLAWKNFLVVISKVKVDDLQLTDQVKEQILSDILSGIQAQFEGGLSMLNMKLASIASALYFTLLKAWPSCVASPGEVLLGLQQTVLETLANSESLLPSIQIGLIGAQSSLLQHWHPSAASQSADMEMMLLLLDTVCRVLAHSTRQLSLQSLPPSASAPTPPTATDPDRLDPRLKLQLVSCSLLGEIIQATAHSDKWLSILNEHSILPILLVSLETGLKTCCALPYIHAMTLLFLRLAQTSAGAEALASNGVGAHTCIPLLAVWNKESLLSRPAMGSNTGARAVSWHNVYCHHVELYSTLLGHLRFSFLEDALNFVGAHQDHLLESIKLARLTLHEASLTAAEVTCGFIHQLSYFSRQWRLHLPDVLHKLLVPMLSMCQTFVALLVRPRYLQHILDMQHRGKELGNQGRPPLQSSPLLQHQASTEDVDKPSTQLLLMQGKMLSVLSRAFSTLRQFTPDLCQVLLEPSLDLEEWEAFLSLSFSTPPIESESTPTFGMLVSTATVCLKLLQKVDPAVASPQKSPEISYSQQISKPLLQHVMENALYLAMSQACRYLREPATASREKQFLKRELGAELNSFLSSLHRYLRKGGPPSPGNVSLAISPQTPGSLNRSMSQASFSSSLDQAIYKLVQVFVQNVLR